MRHLWLIHALASPGDAPGYQDLDPIGPHLQISARRGAERFGAVYLMVHVDIHGALATMGTMAASHFQRRATHEHARTHKGSTIKSIAERDVDVVGFTDGTDARESDRERIGAVSS
jgi:hypothetical protein